MTRTVYLNGRYCPEDDAKVSIFDRGLLFADGVYEVAGVMGGKLVDYAGHMSRLDRSLRELDMKKPLDDDEFLAVHRELVKRNDISEGLVYLQVTRGAADRDFVFDDSLEPTVFLFTQVKPGPENHVANKGMTLKSVPDLRWARRDIKSVGLLAQVMAKRAAKAAGAHEALMIKDGYVSEGGSTTAYIVKDGTVITRPLSNDILPGITRAALLDLVKEKGVGLEERLFTLEEAYNADEAFVTSASSYVCPVIAIDGRKIGGGEPGPVVRRLRDIYLNNARATAL